MIQTGFIAGAHDDLVTDAAYDFYGLRLATGSLDQKIKVWGTSEETGSWAVEDEWKAHDAAITKLAWAHPEFGTVLASSSFDRAIKIWEQLAGEPEGAGAGGPGTRWAERAVLLDARGTVRTVEFSPNEFGLKLATISTDNTLRIYECLEPPSLKAWQLAEEFDVPSLAAGSAGTTAAATLVTGTPTVTASAQLDSNPPAPMLAANALAQQGAPPEGRIAAGSREADGGWALSWCKDFHHGELLAVACGVSSIVKIVQMSANGRPSVLLALEAPPSGATTSSGGAVGASTPGAAASFAVTTVSWAPSCGRTYQLVATGGRDGRVRIWKLRPPPVSDDGHDNQPWTASIVSDFDHHKSTVTRVEWNITGTVLSSAGNDGRVRVWKATAGGVWRPAGHISVEQADQPEQDVDMIESGERRRT